MPDDECRVGNRRELDPDDAARKPAFDRAPDFGGQPGFSTAASARQRYEPRGQEDVTDRRYLPFAANEAGQRRWDRHRGREW